MQLRVLIQVSYLVRFQPEASLSATLALWFHGGQDLRLRERVWGFRPFGGQKLSCQAILLVYAGIVWSTKCNMQRATADVRRNHFLRPQRSRLVVVPFARIKKVRVHEVNHINNCN